MTKWKGKINWETLKFAVPWPRSPYDKPYNKVHSKEKKGTWRTHFRSALQVLSFSGSQAAAHECWIQKSVFLNHRRIIIKEEHRWKSRIHVRMGRESTYKYVQRDPRERRRRRQRITGSNRDARLLLKLAWCSTVHTPRCNIRNCRFERALLFGGIRWRR